MGQKVHPLGFRLVSTQKHKSIWFIDYKNYANLVWEDAVIRTFLERKENRASISKIEIKRNSNINKINILIYTAKPGLLVGISCSKLKNFYLFLKKTINKENTVIISVVPIDNPDSKAILIGDFIVALFKKRIPFKKVINKAIVRAQLADILGIKVQVSGRLNGADIARSEWIRQGRVPLQTLRANIDYTEKRINTIHGILGIKVWLFNQEIL